MNGEATRAQRRGRVERAADHVYGRLGSRVVLVCIALGASLAVATAGVLLAVGFRYLGVSAGQAASFAAIWVPILFALGVIGLWLQRGELRQALSWSPARGGVDAERIWYVGVRLPQVVVRSALFTCIGFPAAALYAVRHFHLPWYDFFPSVIGALVALAAVVILVAFGSELVCAPMLRDIAAHLPPDFEPRARGLQMRNRALAPLPIVTFFAAMTVGAYVDAVHDRHLRISFALGVCTVTVAVATFIFAIVSRSVLSPIDELLAATERVRRGDISTPVPLTSADELGRLSSAFNGMLRDLRQRTDELRASRERIVAAGDAERRRVERDLHDGAQQQLVLAQLKLGTLERLVTATPTAAALASELRGDLDRALSELRDLAQGLYPPLLETEGLPAALSEAARRSAITASVDCDGVDRYRPELEAAVYFCCLEALQNVAKHAGNGARATVRLTDHRDRLRFEVADDGRGFEPAGASVNSGLQNITDRIGALGGIVSIGSAPGAGTTIVGTIPLDSGGGESWS